MYVARDAKTHPIPDNTPSPIAALLTACWAWEPAARPDFTEIYQQLLGMKGQIAD